MPANSNPLRIINMPVSSDIGQFVAVDSSGARASAGAAAIGFTTVGAKAGSAAPVCVMGSAVAWAGASITIGQALEVGSNGSVIPRASGAQIGTALNSAASGDQVEVLIGAAASVSGAGVFRTRRNIGTKAWYGALETDTAASITLQTIAAMEAQFDAVRVILAHVDTNALPGVKVGLAVGGDVTNVTGTGLTWTTATFAGAGSGTLPAGAAQRPSYLATDWMPLASIPRTDGGTLPLLYVRTYLAPGANPFTRQFGSAGMQTLNSVADGRVAFCSYQTGVDGVGTPSSYTNSTSRGINAAYIIQYMARGQVRSYVAFGDSILAGQTIAIQGRSFPVLSALAASQAGTPTECANLGWGGQTLAQIYQRAADLMPILQPQAAVFQSWSDNGATATDAWWATQRGYLSQFLTLANANGTVPIIITAYPTSATNGFNAAQDTRRKSLTDDVMALYSQTAIACDTFTAGQAPGSFPAYWANGYTAGAGNATEHPNEAGQAAMAAAFTAQVLTRL